MHLVKKCLLKEGLRNVYLIGLEDILQQAPQLRHTGNPFIPSLSK